MFGQYFNDFMYAEQKHKRIINLNMLIKLI